MKKQFESLKLNLQFFGEEGETAASTETNAAEAGKETKSLQVSEEEKKKIKELELKLGIEQWKKENLQAIIEEEVAKKTNPNETAEQKRIRELEQTLAEMQSSKAKAEMFDGIMTETLKDGNIKMTPEVVKEFVIKDTPEATKDAFNRLNDFIKQIVSEQVENGVNSRFQRQATSFNTGNKSGGDAKLSLAEQIANELNGGSKKNNGRDLWS